MPLPNNNVLSLTVALITCILFHINAIGGKPVFEEISSINRKHSKKNGIDMLRDVPSRSLS